MKNSVKQVVKMPKVATQPVNATKPTAKSTVPSYSKGGMKGKKSC